MSDYSPFPNDTTPEPRQEMRTFKPRGGTAKNVLLSIVLFVVCVGGLLVAAAAAHVVTLAAVGLVQLVAVVPLLIFAKRRHNAVLLRVTLIGAGLIFLLNASCWGVLLLEGGIH